MLLAGFQAALAAGAPWGRAAWGGKYAVLPPQLRIGSVVATFVWLAAAVVVLDRGDLPLIDIPDAVSLVGTWLLVPVLILGAIVNFASSSPYERFGWGPLAAVSAILCLLLALG